jgi:hypothetical protein
MCNTNKEILRFSVGGGIGYGTGNQLNYGDSYWCVPREKRRSLIG